MKALMSNETTTPTESAVFGVVERQGRAVARKVADTSGATLLPIIRERVMPRSTIYTDEWKPYKRVGGMGYFHERIHHSEKVYVSGDVHTNSIEGFWSLVKRGINGVYNVVSAKHLQEYLNEYAWRYNHRQDGRAQFETLLLRSVGS